MTEVWWPGDEQLLTDTLDEARRAGVPAWELQHLLDESARDRQDRLTVPVLLGKIHYTIRQRRAPKTTDAGWDT